MNRPTVLVASGLFGLLWILLLPRMLTLLLIGLFIVSALVPQLRRIRYLNVTLFALTLSASWSPLDITFIRVPGGPKFIRCCPGSPYRDLDATVERMDRGECMVCSDLLPLNGNPELYWVW